MNQEFKTQIISTTEAAFNVLCNSLKAQANLQWSMKDYELANQLQAQAEGVTMMSYLVRKELQKSLVVSENSVSL